MLRTAASRYQGRLLVIADDGDEVVVIKMVMKGKVQERSVVEAGEGRLA